MPVRSGEEAEWERMVTTGHHSSVAFGGMGGGVDVCRATEAIPAPLFLKSASRSLGAHMLPGAWQFAFEPNNPICARDKSGSHFTSPLSRVPR